MHEHVLATFLADEAEALGVIEPFHGSGFTIRHGLLLATMKNAATTLATARTDLQGSKLDRTMGRIVGSSASGHNLP
jgi:hypothetical protein